MSTDLATFVKPEGLEARALSLAVGRKVGVGGDSITNGSSAGSADLAFPMQAQRIAGSARASITAYGVPGERSDQLLARVPGILAAGVEHLHIQIGTNDGSQSVALTTFQTNIKAMVKLCRSAGVSISVGLVPPRGSAFSTQNALNERYNLWLRLWCPKQRIPLADTWTALVDPTTGFMADAYNSGDNTHPNAAGHLAMAYAVAPVIAGPRLRATPFASSVSGIGLIANPLVASTSGWADQGGTATNSSIATEAAAPGDGLPAGQWLRGLVNNGAGGSTVTRQWAHTLDATKYSAGDVLAVVAHMKANGKLQLTNNGTAFTVVGNASASIPAPGPILVAATVPASPGTLRLGLVVTADPGQTLAGYVGCAQVHNLTTGGLVGLV